MKQILVTGGTWYIWSHGVVELLEKWYFPVIVDNLSNSSLEVLDNIEKITGKKPDFFEVDLRDYESLEKVFEKYDFEAVIHFAWLKAVWESAEKPFFYYENNILWSINLFELMEQYDCKKIIFSSSATVYDSVKNPPFMETDPVWNTTNPYGTTKFLIENILRDLSIHKWFQVVNLRYFNPIWAHKSWFIWENPNGIPNNLLPFIMKVVVWELPAVQVFWDDYETKDGTGERDYIHVVDLIEGHLKALEFIFQNPYPNFSPYQGKGTKWKDEWFFETFNLWTGTATSVMDMISFTWEVIWKEVPYIIKPRRAWDLPASFCNPEKAWKILNWKANLSIKDAIRDSYNFMMKK